MYIGCSVATEVHDTTCDALFTANNQKRKTTINSQRKHDKTSVQTNEFKTMIQMKPHHLLKNSNENKTLDNEM